MELEREAMRQERQAMQRDMELMRQEREKAAAAEGRYGRGHGGNAADSVVKSPENDTNKNGFDANPVPTPNIQFKTQ